MSSLASDGAKKPEEPEAEIEENSDVELEDQKPPENSGEPEEEEEFEDSDEDATELRERFESLQGFLKLRKGLRLSSNDKAFLRDASGE